MTDVPIADIADNYPPTGTVGCDGGLGVCLGLKIEIYVAEGGDQTNSSIKTETANSGEVSGSGAASPVL